MSPDDRHCRICRRWEMKETVLASGCRQCRILLNCILRRSSEITRVSRAFQGSRTLYCPYCASLVGIGCIYLNMGENAKKTWEWHNTVVGEGYQARGVVRQRVSEEPATVKVIDMRAPAGRLTEKVTREADKVREGDKTSRNKEEKKKSKSSKHKRRTNSDSDSDDHNSRSQSKKARFNPLLQALSIRLRDNLSSV